VPIGAINVYFLPIDYTISAVILVLVISRRQNFFVTYCMNISVTEGPLQIT